MNALTLRGIVAEELGSLKLHVIGKCGGLGELRKTCWTRELPGFGTRHYASGRKVYIVQARMEGRTRTVTIGNAKVLFLSGYAPESFSDMLEKYPVHYLSKPVTMEQLVGRVKELLAAA